MDKENIDKFIQGVPFFKEFSEHEKGKLTSDKNSFKQFKKGESIFMEGDTGSSLFVVLFGTIDLVKLCDPDTAKGRVSLKEEEEKVLGELETGSVFGEISMLTGRRRSVTARTTSPKAIVMEITNQYVDSLIHSIQTKFHKQLLLALVKDLDDMDVRYMKLRSSVETKANLG